MKGYQTVVQETLRNHDQRRRYLTLLAAFSLLIAVVVSLALVKPAESRTGEIVCGLEAHTHTADCYTLICGQEESPSHTHTEACYELTCTLPEHTHSAECYSGGENPEILTIADGGTNWFEQPQQTIPEGAVDFGKHLTDLQVTVDGKPGTPDGDGNFQFETEADADKVDADVTLKYHLDENSGVTKEQPYLYFKLPEGFVVPEGLCGQEMKVWDGDHLAGYYSIDPDTGLIVIKFLPSYIDDYINGRAFDGSIQFSGSIKREDSATGDRHLDFGQFSLDMSFPDRGYGVEKSGTVKKDGNGKATITWTVTVTKEATNDFKGAVLSDEKFPKDGKGVTISPEGVNGTWKDGTFTFAEVPADANSVTFTYTEEVDYDPSTEATHTNSAKLKPDGSEFTFTTDASVKIESFTAGKSGLPDMLGQKIDWSVDVHTTQGETLKGYTVQDDSFPADGKGIVVKDANGKTLALGTDYTYDPDTKTLTFSDTCDATDVTIEYAQPFEEDWDLTNDKTVNNTATVTPPDGTPKTSNASVTVKDKGTLTKTGDLVEENGVPKAVKWRIALDSGHKGDATSLDGYVLTDDAFKDLDLSDITIYEAVCDYWSGDFYTEMGTDGKLYIKGSDGTVWGIIEKTENGDLQITCPEDAPSGGLDILTFSYQTELPEGFTAGTLVSNTVSDNLGKTDTGTVVGRSSVEKTHVGPAEETVKGTEFSHDITWELDITYDGDTADKTLSDTLKTPEGKTSKHYYIELDSFKVSAGGVQLKKGTDYEITFEPEGSETPTGFHIKFLKDVASHIHVEYKGHAEGSAEEGGYGEYVFSNTAEFSDVGGSSDDYKITLENPDVGNLTVIKQWKNYQSGEELPAEIEYAVKRTSDGGVSWEYVKYDEEKNTWVKADSQTDAKRTFTPSSDPTNADGDGKATWEFTIDDLPNKDSGGNPYTYVVEEIVPSGATYEASYREGGEGVSADDRVVLVNTRTYGEGGFNKYAIDENKNPVTDGTQFEESSLTKVKDVDGKEYYVFGYEITFAPGDIWIEDTLPEGAELIPYGAEGELSTYVPKIRKKGKPSFEGLYESWALDLDSYKDFQGSGYFYEQNTNTLYYYESGKELVECFRYYIKVPVDNLKPNELYNLKNVATDGDQKRESSLPVNPMDPDEKKKPYLTKVTLNEDGNGGYVVNPKDGNGNFLPQGTSPLYGILLNPWGKEMSSGDYVDLTDLLNLSDYKFSDGNSGGDLTAYFDNSKFAVYAISTADDIIFTEDGEVDISNAKLVKLDSGYTLGWELDKVVEVASDRADISATVSDDHVTVSMPSEYKGDLVTLKLRFQGPASQKLSGLYLQKHNYDPSYQIPLPDLSFDTDGWSQTISVTLDTSKLDFSWDNVQFYFDISGADNSSANQITDIKLEGNTIEHEYSGQLTLSVPDATALLIVYGYTLRDEKGQLLQPNVTYKADNRVELTTDGIGEREDGSEKQFKVSTSSATVQSGGDMSLVKTDASNHSRRLKARFYIAKYNGADGWFYATDVNPDSGGGNTLTFSDVAVQGDTIPDDAKAIETAEGESFVLSEEFATGYYKVIEVQAPEGYYGSDTYIAGLGEYKTLEELIRAYYTDLSNEKLTPYKSFLDKFTAVHYFSYKDADGELGDPPTVNAEIEAVPARGELWIENTKLINITATKNWQTSGDTANNEVEFTLLWSTEKLKEGVVPNEKVLTKANAEDLGLKELTNPQTVKGNASCVWENLPAAIDGNPVYYYVVETSYTANGITYTLQSDGSYLADDGRVGSYRAIYRNDGLNIDGEVVVVNTQGLRIEKRWLNGDNMSVNPSEVNGKSIDFTLRGTNILTGEQEVLYKGTLNGANEWTWSTQGTFTYDEKQYNLSDYTDLQVSEDTVPEGYTVSYDSNLQAFFGEMHIVNKSQEKAAVRDVNVTKKWLDVEPKHDAITATLYYSTKKLSNPQPGDGNLTKVTPEWLEKFQKEPTEPPAEGGTGSTPAPEAADFKNPVTLEASNLWKYKWEDLPVANEDGTEEYYYYVFEGGVPAGYEVSYERQEYGSRTDIVISNLENLSLTASKAWVDSSGKDISAEQKAQDLKFRLWRSTTHMGEEKKIESFTLDDFHMTATYDEEEEKYTIDGGPWDITGLEKGKIIIVRMQGTPGMTLRGGIGYSSTDESLQEEDKRKQVQWQCSFDSFGYGTVQFYVPDDCDGTVQFAIWSIEGLSVDVEVTSAQYYVIDPPVDSAYTNTSPTLGDDGNSLVGSLGTVSFGDMVLIRITYVGDELFGAGGLIGYADPNKNYDWYQVTWPWTQFEKNQTLEIPYMMPGDRTNGAAGLQVQVWDAKEHADDFLISYTVIDMTAGTDPVKQVFDKPDINEYHCYVGAVKGAVPGRYVTFSVKIDGDAYKNHELTGCVGFSTAAKQWSDWEDNVWTWSKTTDADGMFTVKYVVPANFDGTGEMIFQIWEEIDTNSVHVTYEITKDELTDLDAGAHGLGLISTADPAAGSDAAPSGKEGSIDDLAAGDVISFTLTPAQGQDAPEDGFHGTYTLIYTKSDGTTVKMDLGTGGDWIGVKNGDGTYTWSYQIPVDQNLKDAKSIQFYVDVDSDCADTVGRIDYAVDFADRKPYPSDAQLVSEYTLSAADGWKHGIEDLPTVDSHGRRYYYYLEELGVPEGFAVSYDANGNAVSDNGGAFGIINTRTEEPGVQLPSTGGRGTRFYEVFGLAVLLTAGGLLWKKKRTKES